MKKIEIVKFKTKQIQEKELQEIIKQNILASKSKVILRKASNERKAM